jgi:hypothetical protein
MSEMRICVDCKHEKPFEEYYKDKRGRDGIQAACKKCTCIRNKSSQLRNLDRVIETRKKYYESNKELIQSRRLDRIAKERLAKGEPVNKKVKYNETPEEKKLRLQAYRKQYRDNPENAKKAKEYKQQWHQQHKVRLNEKAKEYNVANMPKRKEYLKGYLPRRRNLRKERFQTDLLYRVTANLRTCITRAFKIRQGWGKLGKSEEILGGRYEVVIKHIEDQLHGGMTWENYGAGHGCWNIDHRIPLASAKTVEEVKALCHYTNLQPLWFIDNVRKQDKMPEEWEAMQK